MSETDAETCRHAIRENAAVGEEHEHLLIGSLRWQEALADRAARNGKGWNVNSAIAHAIQHAEAQATDRAAHLTIERSTDAMETETGKQLHYAFINHLELIRAMERLEIASVKQYRHYRLFEFMGKTVEEIAEAEGASVYTIEQSLRTARRFLRNLILEWPQ